MISAFCSPNFCFFNDERRHHLRRETLSASPGELPSPRWGEGVRRTDEVCPGEWREGRVRCRSDFQLCILHFVLRVAPIREERQQSKGRAQHILALRNPGDGLDPQRVQRKEGRHRRTTPHRPGHLSEQEEQQNGIRGVEGDVRQMMKAGADAKPLTIQHVGQRGDRMPIPHHGMGERVAKTVRGQAGLDLLVFGDELRIVVIDEVVMPHRPIHGGGHHDEQQTNYQLATHPLRFSLKRLKRQ